MSRLHCNHCEAEFPGSVASGDICPKCGAVAAPVRGGQSALLRAAAPAAPRSKALSSPPPPPAEPQAGSPELEQPAPKRRGPYSWFSVSSGFGASMVVHLALLLVLALITFAAGGFSKTGLALLISPEPAEFEEVIVSITDFSNVEDSPSMLVTSTALRVEAEPIPDTPPDTALLNRIEFAEVRLEDPLADLPAWNELNEAVYGTSPLEREEDRLRRADSPEQAIEAITGEMEMRLAEGPLLCVWLFDASISLRDDRRRAAEHLEPILARLQNRGRRDTTFRNAVAAFGNTSAELVAPTFNNRSVVNAAASLPEDPSGVENVMSAVVSAAQKYRRRWKDPLMLVVWTDESGDDVANVEEAIARCRELDVSVTVVGPTAVFGRQMGLQAFTVETGQVFMLPVMRGPESAFPECVQLAFFSGEQRILVMPSGLPPYGLVRLAQATGGAFITHDRPLDRGPFDLETLRPYLPDLRPLAVQREELAYHPLRQAVVQAAALTHEEAPLVAPRMSYFSVRPPGTQLDLPLYYPPASFRRLLGDALADDARSAEAAAQVVERALEFLAHPLLEVEYEREESLRWRAAYDLAKGRLLLQSVRYAEYRLMCRSLKPKEFPPEVNFIQFLPATSLRSGEFGQQRLTAALEHLQRCVEQHSGTPWGAIAAHELSLPPGLTVAPRIIPQPEPVATDVIPSTGPGPSLPNL